MVFEGGLRGLGETIDSPMSRPEPQRRTLEFILGRCSIVYGDIQLSLSRVSWTMAFV